MCISITNNVTSQDRLIQAYKLLCNTYKYERHNNMLYYTNKKPLYNVNKQKSVNMSLSVTVKSNKTITTKITSKTCPELKSNKYQITACQDRTK